MYSRLSTYMYVNKQEWISERREYISNSSIASSPGPLSPIVACNIIKLGARAWGRGYSSIQFTCLQKLFLKYKVYKYTCICLVLQLGQGAFDISQLLHESVSGDLYTWKTAFGQLDILFSTLLRTLDMGGSAFMCSLPALGVPPSQVLRLIVPPHLYMAMEDTHVTI